jgi:hypothetical protein
LVRGSRLTGSFSSYIPSIFKKPENIGFDRLGNKNLRRISIPHQTFVEANITFADGNGFLLPEREFSSALVENRRSQGAKEPGAPHGKSRVRV